MPSLNDILAVILGGGRGARLYPLTQMRSKPAVPIAGKYRLIDIPISNCINSGIYRIAVLTQFNSVSLHRHITNTYDFDAFHTGWVQIWAAEQTLESADWYQGTADAVRKQTLEIQSSGAKNVLILAGDPCDKDDHPQGSAHSLRVIIFIAWITKRWLNIIGPAKPMLQWRSSLCQEWKRHVLEY